MKNNEKESVAGVVPTVSRVCADQTLIELVYDPEKRKTALAVSRFGGLWNIEQEVRIETGEVLVPYSPENNLIASECVLLPSKPVECGLKHELVADIQAFLHRYVDLSPLFEQIAAYYVLLTWVHDAFNELAYLRLRGDYGTGKTRALMTIGALCYRPFFASGASTVSPIFHTIDSFGGTLIFDEGDLVFSDAKTELVKILNNGTVRGMPVLRTIQNRQREFNPKAFKVFGPKIIAMRDEFDDRALESRMLTEEMTTRTPRNDIPVHLPATFKVEALELRNRLLHFRLCELFKIKPDASTTIEGIAPRVNQTVLALLSLIDDEELRRQLQDAMIERNAELLIERSETVEAFVLTAVLEAASRAKGPNVPVREIADAYNATHGHEYGGPFSCKWIGHILRRRLRLKTRKSGGIYTLSASEKPKIDALAIHYGIGG